MPDATLTSDVLVVGGGPAGLAAATVAAESGARVLLIDSAPGLGGPYWRSSPDHVPDQARSWIDRLTRAGVRVLDRTAVVAAPAAGLLLAERPDGAVELHWNRLVLAPGARELFLPFPRWTLPGIFGVGGLQVLVKSGWPVAGKNVVVAGSGPLLLAAAAKCRDAGARVRAVAEQAPWPALARFAAALPGLAPSKLAQAAGYRWTLRGTPFWTGCYPVAAHGTDHVEAVTLTDGRRTRTVSCDVLACAFGLLPNLELPAMLGCAMTEGFVTVDDAQQSSVPGVFCAGEITGIGGADRALIEGQIAGLAAAGRTDAIPRLRPARDRAHRFGRTLETAFRLRPELRLLATLDTTVCRCEDVTRRQLEPCSDQRSAKLHTRCGMGPCQGRVCNGATAFLFGWQPNPVRPPVVACRVGTLLADPPDPST